MIKNNILLPRKYINIDITLSSFGSSKRIWSLGLVNLKPRLLIFSCLTKDFNLHNQNFTHAHI